MMRKFFGILFIALCAMTSCTFEDGEGIADTAGLHDVYIKFENAGMPGTRAEEVPKTGTDKVTFTNGYLFFLTAQDQVKQCYHIMPAGVAANKANYEIALADFWGGASGSGYLFENVSGEVKKVYLIGNMPGTIADPDIRAITTLGKLKELAAGIETQDKVDEVLIDGMDDNLQSDPSDATQQTANITLTPLCSRIEIARLTAGGNVTAYMLTGIYVSHFYTKMAFNETPDALDLKKYAAAGGADYTVYKLLCDQPESPATSIGTQSGLVTTPTVANNVWAYQFFPGTGASRVPPRIVIKLTGVAASVGSFDATKDYYLNIRGFKTPGAGNVDPISLERGKVYKIVDVPFLENDISDIPNPEDINLTVNVEIAAWVIETVEPIM